MVLKTSTSEIYTPGDVSHPIVITYDNTLGEEKNSAAFKETLDTHRWQYAFISISDTYKAHRDKLDGYRQMLNMLPPDKIVVLSDSRDVFCCRNVKAFMNGYRSLKSDFIVSMELFCNKTTAVVTKPIPQCVPLVKYWKHHKREEWPMRKYVNSGLIVGKAINLIDFFNYATEHEFHDDQEALGDYMNNYPDKVLADIDATLLHSTTFGVNAGIFDMHLQKHDSPTYAELFGRSAFFLHFPGCCSLKGQGLMYEVTRKLIMDGNDSNKLNLLYDYDDFDWGTKF
jgi:hypothetical protein